MDTPKGLQEWLSTTLDSFRKQGIDGATIVASMGRAIRGEPLPDGLNRDALAKLAWLLFVDMPRTNSASIAGRSAWSSQWSVLLGARLGRVLEGSESLEEAVARLFRGKDADQETLQGLQFDRAAIEHKIAQARSSMPPDLLAFAQTDALTAEWIDDGPDRAEALRRLAELAPGPRARLRMALSSARRAMTTGRADRFAAAVETAIEVAPNYFEPYLLRAILKMRQGLDESAEADLARALSLAPGSPMALEERARLRERRGDVEGSLADCSAALQAQPESVDLLCLRVSASVNAFVASLNTHGSGNVEHLARAVADCNVVLSQRPDDAKASAHRALARSYLGDWNGALSDWAKSLDVEPSAIVFFERAIHGARHQSWGCAWADVITATALDPETALEAQVSEWLVKTESHGACDPHNPHGWPEALVQLEANLIVVSKRIDHSAVIDVAQARLKALGEKSRGARRGALRKLRANLHG